MSESEIRAELLLLLGGAEVGEHTARLIADRIMDMVAEYASDERSDAASDAIRDYEERM